MATRDGMLATSWGEIAEHHRPLMRFPVVLAFRVTKRRIRQALTLHVDDAKTATLINTPHLPPGVRGY